MIAVIVPTIRPEQIEKFREDWRQVFHYHDVVLIEVHDGDQPSVQTYFYNQRKFEFPPDKGPVTSDIPEEWAELIYNRTDAVRNFGFLYALQNVPKLMTILTLDDDVFPDPNSPYDPIQQHLDALYAHYVRKGERVFTQNRYVPISWFSTASEYMRGFPYGIRREAEVWVSHGVWEGVHDYDGPTQLVNGIKPATFYKGPIPKGCLSPICGMNLAFKKEALPYVYFAPMGKELGVQRFADIWMGINLKRYCDHLNKAIVTGYSVVEHTRMSNVLNNLEQEARGIIWNESMDGPNFTPEQVEYLKLWEDRRDKWLNLVDKMLKEKS
jgi:hypothetical protein